MIGLRYPGHDTLGCFSSPRLCRPALNSKLGGVCEQCAGQKSRDNIGQERRQAEFGLTPYKKSARKPGCFSAGMNGFNSTYIAFQ